MPQLSRRLLTIGGAAGLTIAMSGCGDAPRGDDPLIPVLERAAKADSSFGVRYRFHGYRRDSDGTTRFRGYGQTEADQHRTREVEVLDDTRGETIIDGHVEYDGGDFAVTSLLDSPSRTIRWTKLDRSKFVDAGLIDKLCGTELPAKVASVLADSDPKVEPIGSARIGGANTRRYRITTSYGRLLDLLAGDEDASDCHKHDRATTFTAQVWIDGHDLIRRVRFRARLADGLTVQTRDITRYDRDVRVALPRADTVGDVTDELIDLSK